jgi:hypothetical protein
MPKPPAEAFRGALEQHRNSREPRYLDQTLNGGLDMSNAHRDVPPVEDMFHLTIATHGIPYEVRQSKLAIRDHRQQTAGLAPKFGHLFSHAAVRRRCRICDQASSSAHIAALNLTDHESQVLPPILRSTAEMRTFQKNRQTPFGRCFNRIA